eukprot:TRINITY_DN106620_c0_g1_i1.p1 TRINITY_DN106620_c0_g1~~TRINITY_DN106620_c0_g1_i1.p1  ORF type:complete len:105 (-),score=9.41 TRINITY_DN106620_c0_g1_i1:86-400(-)
MKVLFVLAALFCAFAASELLDHHRKCSVDSDCSKNDVCVLYYKADNGQCVTPEMKEKILERRAEKCHRREKFAEDNCGARCTGSGWDGNCDGPCGNCNGGSCTC